MSALPPLEKYGRLLAEISGALTASNDGESCIREAVALAVPEYCDLLVVDLTCEDELRRLAFALDERTGATLSLADNALLLPDRAEVLQRGESVHGPSFAVAPLLGRGQVLGCVTAVWCSGRMSIVGGTERALLREMGRRFARVVDHAQLCRQVEAVARTKEEFIATLSHELRTPLTSILGWSNLLKSGELDHATRRMALDAIERNARAQAKLIEEMLDISCSMSGTLKLDLQTLELAEIAADVADTLRPMAIAKNIGLNISIDDDTPRIEGDRQRIGQIVWHLLSNAIKFTPGGGRIELAVEHTGDYVSLSVRDSGEGIPRAFLPHVFDHFSQVDGSSTRRHGGLGLGLAVVRHLAEMHGATVSAESDGTNCGAKVSVHFREPGRITLGRIERTGANGHAA